MNAGARVAVNAGDRCPCLSGNTYGECCLPFHRGEQHAPTAERLMRSRYSAFAVGDAAYLLESWHPSTRPATLELDPSQRWYRLDIVHRTGGGMLDNTGTVEFVARYRLSDESGESGERGERDGSGERPEPGARPTRGELHETSTFARHDRKWFYVSG